MQSGRRGFSSDYCGCWTESMCLLELSGGVCGWASLDLYVSHICELNRLLLSISTVGLFKNGRNIKKLWPFAYSAQEKPHMGHF